MTAAPQPSARQLTVTVNADHQHIVTLEPIDMPVPAADEVVVEVQATPVNPSDLAVLYGGADLSTARVETVDGRPALVSEGQAGWGRALAGMVGQRVSPGNEGAGTVVAAGASPAAQALLGRVVTMVGGEMFRTHRLLKARQAVPLPQGAPAAEGASLFVNPMTVQGFLDTMEREGHTALIHTAAASNLGQMLARLCVEREVPLVAVVRSARQRAILEELGLTHIVDSSEPDFMEALVSAVHTTGATVAFDAVGGGTMADTLLRAMEQAQLRAGQVASVYGTPVHKQVYIYGRLDQRPTTLSAGLGFYWGVGAWLLTPRLQQLGGAGVLKMRQYAIAERNGIFASHYTATVGLDALLDPETARAIDRKATGQKFLVDPSQG
jgi:NADPH:quinone reductase-like Zn-dependent oxidoreductase